MFRTRVIIGCLVLLGGLALGEETPYDAGKRYLEEKRYEDALREAEKILDDPALASYAYDLKGLALYYLERYALAKKAFLQAMDGADEKTDIRASARRHAAMACLAMAIRSQNEGQVEEARDTYREAIEIDPDYDDALFRYGKILVDLQAYEEAEKRLSRYLALSGSTPANRASAHYWIGMIAFEEGDLWKARIHFRSALEIDPKRADAILMLDRLDRSIAVVRRTMRTETLLLVALVVILVVYVGGGYTAFRLLRKRSIL
ncbi:MAG: tetratricopeptide repeat protein [Planctomycetota bacterium]|jgi:tetratricopeptide (TPR) repeat protein